MKELLLSLVMMEHAFELKKLGLKELGNEEGVPIYLYDQAFRYMDGLGIMFGMASFIDGRGIKTYNYRINNKDVIHSKFFDTYERCRYNLLDALIKHAKSLKISRQRE